jgi:hypothetical protein
VPVAPQPTVVVAQPVPPPPPVTTHPGSSLRTTGIVIGSLGLAGLATAIALNLKANSLADEANKNYDPATESSQKDYKTGALVCYGIGGAALVTGTVLYLVGRSRGTASSSGLALAPFWKPSAAGLALGGEF